MEKVKWIKKFLFDETIDIEERKERLELTYFIWEVVDSITFRMRKNTMNILLNKIKDSVEFRDYKIVDKGFLKSIRNRPLCIFKPEWCHEDGNPIFYYAFQALENNLLNLSIGIKKYSKKIPFQGDWKIRFCSMPIEVTQILCDLYNTLSSPKSWSKVFDISWWWSSGWEVSSGNLSEWGEWIVWLPFPPRYRMNSKTFYLEVIEKGYDAVANYYFIVLASLKDATELFINKLIEIYKKGGVLCQK